MNAGAVLLIQNLTKSRGKAMEQPGEKELEMIGDMKFLLRMALAGEIAIEDLETIGVISRKWGLVQNNDFEEILNDPKNP